MDLPPAEHLTAASRLLARLPHRASPPVQVVSGWSLPTWRLWNYLRMMDLHPRLTQQMLEIRFGEMARQAHSVETTLPCEHYERDEDVLPNRVLLAGLQLAAGVAIDGRVRQRAMRPLMALAETVQSVSLNAGTLRTLERGKSRLLAAYDPVFGLIRLLLAGRGISMRESVDSLPLPGFLFNMNLLFQQALGRFFRESLEGVTVLEQYSVADMFEYQPLFNPRRKHGSGSTIPPLASHEARCTFDR